MADFSGVTTAAATVSTAVMRVQSLLLTITGSNVEQKTLDTMADDLNGIAEDVGVIVRELQDPAIKNEPEAPSAEAQARAAVDADRTDDKAHKK